MSGPARLRRAVIAVAAANLLYFGVEFVVARRITSVSLLADSVDFLEDASVNCLIAVGLGWPIKARARLGMVLAAILLLPALAATLGAAGLTIAFGLIGTFSALGQKPAAVLRHL